MNNNIFLRNADNTAAKRICQRYAEMFDSHYVIHDVLENLVSDESYLPKRLHVFVCYNNGMWNALIDIDNTGYLKFYSCEDGYDDAGYQDVRKFAAFVISRYAQAIGTEAIVSYRDKNNALAVPSEDVTLEDFLSGKFDGINAVMESEDKTGRVIVRDHWGLKNLHGISVELWAPNMSNHIPDSMKNFYQNRFMKIS